jgi:hypothetical protein
MAYVLAGIFTINDQVVMNNPFKKPPSCQTVSKTKIQIICL